MKRTSVLWITALTLLSFLWGCEKSRNIEKIQGNVLIGLEEVNGSIILECETEKIYPEIGNVLHYRMHKGDDEFVIRFVGAEQIGGYMALGPADAEIFLGQLDDGNYRCVFQLNDQISEAQLTVDDTVMLEFNTQGNVRPMNR